MAGEYVELTERTSTIQEQEEVEEKIEAKGDLILAQLREITLRLDRLEHGENRA